MLNAIDAIHEYTAEMTFADFRLDRKTVDAVIRNLIIIGEAAVRMPEDICRKYPDAGWHEMRGMRNFVVHEYFRASDRVLWDTIERDLPPLRHCLQKIIHDG